MDYAKQSADLGKRARAAWRTSENGIGHFLRHRVLFGAPLTREGSNARRISVGRHCLKTASFSKHTPSEHGLAAGCFVFRAPRVNVPLSWHRSRFAAHFTLQAPDSVGRVVTPDVSVPPRGSRVHFVPSFNRFSSSPLFLNRYFFDKCRVRRRLPCSKDLECYQVPRSTRGVFLLIHRKRQTAKG